MAESQVSSKWVVIATLAVVVAAFLGASGYAEYRAGRTHALTSEIANNESPSIMHLAAARAELRDLQRLLNTHVLQAATGRATDVKELKDVRDRLRDHLQAYFAIPALPGERELWAKIEKELTDVDVLAGRIVEATAAGRHAAAQQLLVVDLPRAIDDEADAIIAAIQMNARHVGDVAHEIEGERRSRTAWVFGLDGVAVALAIALAVIALRTIARQEELRRRRLDELEGFAGRVAHDLLNPISAAEMSLTAAERAVVGSERRAAVMERARRSLGRARRLIDDLLAFAQAGARPDRRAASAVTEVIDGVIDELRPAAQARQIAVDVEQPANLPPVRCAPGVLASVLANLLRNAIKHMGDRPRRQIRVRVASRSDRVRFEVEDSGPGLPPDLVPEAFDPYVRGAGTREPGLGLGLATVRRLVDGHDGRYGVSSRLGEGALFWFELPAVGRSVGGDAPAMGAAGAARDATAAGRMGT
jgi:signal transduction histidine kinase